MTLIIRDDESLSNVVASVRNKLMHDSKFYLPESIKKDENFLLCGGMILKSVDDSRRVNRRQIVESSKNKDDNVNSKQG